MKVTIAQLQEEIGRLKVEKQSWYEKYRELKDAEEERYKISKTRFDVEQEQTYTQVANLMEVIRWQINPETTKAPFIPMKSERDERASIKY